MMETDVLFEPVRIGSLLIKNRIVMGPMALADSFPPGYASPQTRAVYAERAAGGVGLIIMGGTVGTRQAWESAPFANVLRFDTEETLASLAEIPEVVHRFDCRIFAQLMQGYGRGGSSRIRGVQSAAASPSQLVLAGGMGIPGFTDDYLGEMPRELGLDEISQLEDEVGLAAARAQRAGFDGVELPCFIGYLAAGFLSPRLNRRTDQYGGSLENRARFILNNVRQVRSRTGPEFPIGVRLTADDHVEGGIRLEESMQVARWLVAEGVNYVNVFEGGYEVMELTSSTRDGQMLDNGTPQAFKRELDVPVLCPGVHDPHNAARMIAAGQADMVSLTRALLADPQWASKTRLGRTGEINPCDRSSECVSLLFKGLPVRCRNNPELGWERLHPATTPALVPDGQLLAAQPADQLVLGAAQTARIGKSQPRPRATGFVQSDISDMQHHSEYAKANRGVLKRYGARFLLRWGHQEVAEGTARSRPVVIEFPDYSSAYRDTGQPAALPASVCCGK